MRVVIESKTFADARFRDFAELIGDIEKASGILLHFWLRSQEKLLVTATEKQTMSCILGTPERRATVFKALLEAGYIELRDTHYRIKGNEDRVGARIRRREIAKKASEHAVKRKTTRKATSMVEKNSINGSMMEPSKDLQCIKKKPGQDFIATYCEAYKKRYGVNPIVTPKDGGICQRLLKAVPLEKAKDLIQAYLQIEDRWFMTKCHDLVTFEQNLGKVAVALANGTKDPHEKDFWKKVFGGQNAGKSVQTTG